MTPYYSKDGITIYHGDCREVLPLLERSSVRLCWTDPPYGHGNQDGDLQAARVRDDVKGARKKAAKPIHSDRPDAMRETLQGSMPLIAPLMCRDCCCCCCAGGGGPTVTFAWLAQQMDCAPWSFFHAVIWDKSSRGHGLGWRFRRNYEFVMVSHLRTGSLAWTDDDVAVPNIVHFHPTRYEHHPNEKPVPLVSHFIALTTEMGELVLDPFMGSGTTLVAAKQMGRCAIGIEMSEEYCEEAARRLEQSVFAFPKDDAPKESQAELFAETTEC